ncbi:hypothetical protein F511_06468 [Dorcoceras hygrometricum]|uniref:Uncharacterized protein n=1 Tax=Dorcoceras hygrometricum TaxID=472368 RepID=A0A2Z7BZ03_9LAMI|nr:hypothetical protein F511_06468 [Dorcoceras hygrometricum]
MLISSVLLVQPNEGVSVLVMDRIGDNLPQSTEKSRILVIPVGARHKCQQGIVLNALCMTIIELSKGQKFWHNHRPPPRAAAPLIVARMSARDLRAGRASMTGRALRRTIVEAAHGATFAGPPLRITAPIARAGRAPAAREAAERCAPGRDIVRHGGAAARCWPAAAASMIARWSTLLAASRCAR